MSNYIDAISIFLFCHGSSFLGLHWFIYSSNILTWCKMSQVSSSNNFFFYTLLKESSIFSVFSRFSVVLIFLQTIIFPMQRTLFPNLLSSTNFGLMEDKPVAALSSLDNSPLTVFLRCILCCLFITMSSLVNIPK